MILPEATMALLIVVGIPAGTVKPMVKVLLAVPAPAATLDVGAGVVAFAAGALPFAEASG